MSFTIRLLVLLKGRLVGRDDFGNRYYAEKLRRGAKREPRRWILYKGMDEATKIPPEWHAWAHHRADGPLGEPGYAWSEPHRPNLTGIGALTPFLEKDNVTRFSRRLKKKYEPWNPDE